jgi:hypothetical protein
METVYRSKVPEGYASPTEAGPKFDLSPNAIRLAARRGQVRACLIRNRLFVYVPDLERLFEPRPYPPIASAA